ncbi:MAG: COG1615 family transporter, partial [Symploca sp. SIO3E6]|nr:COG1615 family transporter [Caldora sp. SIO3E6]
MSKRFWNRFFRSVAIILGLWIAWDLLANLVAEILWFQEVDYLDSFFLRLYIQLGLWFGVCVISAGFLLGNLFLANRLKHKKKSSLARDSAVNQQGRNLWDYQTQVQPVGQTRLNLSVGVSQPPLYRRSQDVGIPSARYQEYQQAPIKQKFPTLALGLRSLLLLMLLLCTVVGLMLLHYGSITISLWHPDLSVPHVTPPLPPVLDWISLKQLLLPQAFGIEQVWQLGFVAFVVVALVIQPQFWLRAIAVVLSLFWSLIMSYQWSRIVQYFYPTAFPLEEPQFGHNISFYVFNLPIWQLLDFWLGGLCLFGLVAVVIIYLTSGNSLSQGKFQGFSHNQLRHLFGLSSALAVTVAFREWLSRYKLLYSPRGVSYGASYTDVNIQLSVNTGLSILALAIAILFLSRTIFWFRSLKKTGWVMIGLWGVYLVVELVAGAAVPNFVQHFIVQPNELARERPYIERSIALTRAAFDLNNIEVKAFNPEGKLTRSELAENDLTIRNIRLWDTRPILQTNRQLQQIRLYYQFPDADIDRYTLRVDQERRG